MAENTSYIGVAMGLDVTDLKAGLSEANKQIQLANSEFKAASSGMDDWTKSTDGLTAKVKQLDTVLSLQKKKLAGMQAEYDKIVNSQGENSEAARKLKVQMNNQKSVINATEKEFKNYSETLKGAQAGNIDLEKVVLKNGKALKKQGDAAKESGKGLSGLKSIAGGVGKGLLAIGAAAVGAVGGFLSLASSTRETRENFNKLETGFTTAGHSAEAAQKTYKELYGVLGDEGQATEAAAHLAQLTNNQEELSKWTNIATGVYATFGDSLPIENLTEAANETAKTGKITGGLADALNWAGENEDEFQAKLDACSSEQERQKLITETLNGLYSEQSDKFKELNKDIIEAREADAALSQSMAELGAIAEPIMTTLKLVAVDLIETIKPFVSLIGEGLKGALEGTAGATDKLAEGLGGLISNILEKIVSALPTVISTVSSLISTLLPQIISTITGFLPTLISTLASQLPVILQSVISGFSQILVEVGRMLPKLIPIVIDAVLMIVDTLLDNIDQLIDAGISLLMGLADGLIKALPKLIAKIPVIIEKLLGAISRNAPKLIQSGIELILKLAVGLIKAIPQLLSNIPQIISAIVSGFGEASGEMAKVGLDLLKGIWEGIKDGAGWLKDKITGFAGNVAGWFKKTFKIGSPSKLMADEVGEYLGEGIGVGIIDSIPTVKKQLGKFAGFVQDNLGGIKSGLAINANGNGGSYATRRGNTVVNAGMTVNYNGTLSRKQLKQLENDNYTAIKIRLKTEGAI